MMYVSRPIFWGEVSGMLGDFGADGARAGLGADEEDARSLALHLMSQALAHLDSDSKIPAVIGAHLQSAIDALWTSASGDQHSIHLH
jgi:hypothetical protein